MNEIVVMYSSLGSKRLKVPCNQVDPEVLNAINGENVVLQL